VNSIDATALAAFPAPVAPLAEQRRIVARIGELFSEIAEGEAALAEARKGLEVFRRALLKAAVTGELTRDWRAPSTGPNLHTATAHGSIPESWDWAKLADILTAGPTNGFSPKRSADDVGTLALKLTATTKGKIDLGDHAVKRIAETIAPNSDLFLSSGDLLFQRGNTIEYVGIAAVYEGPPGTYIYPDLMIRVRVRPDVGPKWVWLVANSPQGRKYLTERATGTAGTMPKISGATLRSLPVPMPTTTEIAEIVNRFEAQLLAVDDAAQLLNAETADAARLRQSILKAAFEGRLVQQDENDEPASVTLARLHKTATAPAPPHRRRVKANA
jgi:type I restriction enzyme S subunit